MLAAIVVKNTDIHIHDNLANANANYDDNEHHRGTDKGPRHRISMPITIEMLTIPFVKTSFINRDKEHKYISVRRMCTVAIVVYQGKIWKITRFQFEKRCHKDLTPIIIESRVCSRIFCEAEIAEMSLI